MSIFYKALASFGIGAATVDTVLDQNTYTAGDLIQGKVKIKGGNVAQSIDAIYISLNVNYTNESGDAKFEETASIFNKKLNEPFVIEVNEEKEIPFSFNVPYDAPATVGKTRAWLHTGLDIKMAVDPEDQDAITIRMTPLASNILAAIKKLGFRLREVECEKASLRMRSRYPFVQEYEFIPTSGRFKGYLDELEVVFVRQDAHQVEALFQVDRKARGFTGFLSEALEMDESYVSRTFTQHDVLTLERDLYQLIEQYV